MAYVLLLLVTLTISQISHLNAAPTQSSSPSSSAQEFLAAHNRARAEVGVPPLKWSSSLANATSRLVRYQRNKMACQFANLKSGKYGANQLMAQGMAVTPRLAVETWVKEKQFYNRAANSCAPNHRCGVYTQVVWRKTTEVGCAQGVCGKAQTSLTICFYFPAGNVIGEGPY